MKYIVMQRKIGDQIYSYPIIFPNELVHAHVAKALLHLPGNPYSFMNKVKSAGECHVIDCSCIGFSETLKIDSRHEVDEDLILNRDYTAGVE